MYKIVQRTETIFRTYGVYVGASTENPELKAKIKIECGPISRVEEKEGVVLLNIEEESEVNLIVPEFQHDCDNCIFLGQYGEYTPPKEQDPKDISAGRWVDYDLYHCGGETNNPTVIARFGDDGPEYSSGLSPFYGEEKNIEWAKTNLPYLYEAKRRAELLGLNCERNKYV